MCDGCVYVVLKLISGCILFDENKEILEMKCRMFVMLVVVVVVVMGSLVVYVVDLVKIGFLVK